MTYVITITAKNQVTLPIDLVNKYGLKKGDKLVVETGNQELKIKKQKDILNQLGGSLQGKLPEKFKGLTSEEMITQAREMHYKERFAQKGGKS